MKKHLFKSISLAVTLLAAVAFGAAAQVPAGYVEVEDYLEPFAKENVSGSSSWGDPSGPFAPSLGWSSRPEIWYPNPSSSSNYKVSYAASSSGKNGYCIGNTSTQILSSYQTGGYVYNEVYDLIITPQVKGELKFYLKPYSNPTSYDCFASFFKMHKQDDGSFTFDAQTDSIPFAPVEMTSTTTWVEQTLQLPGSDYEYIGIRLWRIYIDEFQASKALMPINMTVQWASSATVLEGYNQYDVKSDSDGYVTFGVKQNLTNTGNVPIPAGHKVKLMRVISNSTPYTVDETPLAEVDLPPLAPGESQDIPIVARFKVPEDVSADSNGKVRFRIDFWEDYTGVEHTSSSDRSQVGVGPWIEITPYMAVMSISYDLKNSSNVATTATLETTSKPVNYGSFKSEKARVFKVKNIGAAPMVIESVDKPDWIEILDQEFPCTLAPDETLMANVKIGGEPGVKTGSVKFNFSGISVCDVIPVTGEVIGEDVYFANFEGEDALNEWYMPTGSTSWSIYKYSSSERSSNNNIWTLEPDVNDQCLSNSRNEEQGHAIYSPKLSFEEGEEIAFYAAKRQNGGSYVKIIVQYSPDRSNWTELATISHTNTDPNQEFYYSSTNTNSGQNIFKRFAYQMPAGDYYISLTSGYSFVDDFHGGKLAEVGFDLISESAEVGETAIVNNPLTFKTSYKNLTPTEVAASTQRVALYANDEVVAVAPAQTIEAFGTVEYNFEYIPHAAGDTELKAVLTIGQEKFNSVSKTVKVLAESLEDVTQIGSFSTKANGDYETAQKIPLNQYNYNSKSEFIYTKEDLAQLQGSKILKISYPYYCSVKNISTPILNVWMQNTTDAEPTTDEDGKYVFTDTGQMTNVMHAENYAYKPGGGSASDLLDFELVLDEPFDYTGENLRIVVEATLNPEVSGNGGYNYHYYAIDKSEDKADRFGISKASDSYSTYLNSAAGKAEQFPIIKIATEKVVPPVTGTVKDSEGNPIANAYVKAKAADNSDVYYDAQTDQEGKWEMVIYQTERDYTVTAQAEGYYDSTPAALDLTGENNIVLAATSGKFTVTVKANNAAATPLADITVAIKPELAASDDEAMEAVTDDNGVATFEAAAYTDYIVKIADAGKLFQPYESDEAVAHTQAGDNADVVLVENVFAPQSHTVGITKGADGTFDAEITWSMGDLDDEVEYLGYTFAVKVDGGEAVAAQEADATLTGLSDKTDHTVAVIATSPYGTPAETYQFTIAAADLLWGDVTVTVTADNADETPLAGVTVILTPGQGDALQAVTDESGVATFEGLDYGQYTVSVPNAGILFEAYEAESAENHQAKATSIEITLAEIVHKPTSHAYNLVKNADETYQVELTWEMTTLPADDLMDYTFTVQIDDNEALEVEDAAATLDNVEPNKDHTVKIVAVSPYGTEAEPYTFVISKDEVTGIRSIYGADDDCRYFDLNGFEVKSENLQPGIYVRVKGNQTEKILVK